MRIVHSMPNDGFSRIELDARAVKVLAHPLRSRLLAHLRTGGPATATELAAALHTNTGATSYHLRKLEEVALVTDTGEGTGKRRIWRASTEYHSFTPSAFAADDDSATALDWLHRHYLRTITQWAERWYDTAPQWPAAWQDAFGFGDDIVELTPAELEELKEAVDRVVKAAKQRGGSRPGAARISFVVGAFPLDPDAVPS